MLYEMLSGTVPHVGANPCAVLYAQVWEEPRPLKSPHMRLPGDVLGLVSRALAKSPAERHQSARELGADIDTALAAVDRPAWRRLLR
jgi:serine/threonine protein kinase